MRELHLLHGIKDARGLLTSVLKEGPRQGFERLPDGGYVVRFTEDVEHEWLVPASAVRGERRPRQQAASGQGKR